MRMQPTKPVQAMGFAADPQCFADLLKERKA